MPEYVVQNRRGAPTNSEVDTEFVVGWPTAGLVDVGGLAPQRWPLRWRHVPPLATPRRVGAESRSPCVHPPRWPYSLGGRCPYWDVVLHQPAKEHR